MTLRASSLCALAAVLVAAPFSAPAVDLSVDFSHHLGPVVVDRWSSSGLTQPYETACFRQDMEQIGAVPYAGCRFIRPHDLLERVGFKLIDAVPTYQWDKLDSILDTITVSGLTPFFELMGNPSHKFTSFTDPGQVKVWTDLIQALAVHLEQRYGRDAVRGWMFEGWNEPDINFNWKWKSEQEYQTYFDACEAGLHKADPVLRFGGPDVAHHTDKPNDRLTLFLAHCDTGKNWISGKTGTRLDFISYHLKAKPSIMVTREVRLINAILKAHPKYAALPILDDEADSEAGWSETKFEYRATPWYAAFIIRSVDEHLVRIVDGGDIDGHAKIDYRLSNDDAFWAPFVGRTQFAHFGTDDQFALIRKPSHLARVALALLSGQRAQVDGGSFTTGLGAMASVNGEHQAVVILYNYSDKSVPWTGQNGPETNVHLRIKGLPFGEGAIANYRIDADHGDSYGAWLALGSPQHPSDGQIQALRATQDLCLVSPVTALQGPEWDQTFSIPQPGVCVFVFTAPPESEAPVKIGHLRQELYSSLEGTADDVMLRWDDGPRGIRTYSVLYSSGPTEPFTAQNATDLLETGFVLQRPHPASGQVRIEAYDYFGKLVGESDTLQLGREP